MFGLSMVSDPSQTLARLCIGFSCRSRPTLHWVVLYPIASLFFRFRSYCCTKYVVSLLDPYPPLVYHPWACWRHQFIFVVSAYPQSFSCVCLIVLNSPTSNHIFVRLFLICLKVFQLSALLLSSVSAYTQVILFGTSSFFISTSKSMMLWLADMMRILVSSSHHSPSPPDAPLGLTYALFVILSVLRIVSQ